MSYFNTSDLNKLSWGDDDDDTDKKSDILAFIGRADIFNTVGKGNGDNSHFDPKSGQDSASARRKAKSLILGASDKAFTFWEVFKAAYMGKIYQDAWSKSLYYKGEKTTKAKLWASLERILEMARPRTSEGFYDRQLDLLLESFQFNPVKKYLDSCWDRYQDPLPEWDNLGKLLFGSDDALTQKMLTTWLVGAAKRGINPGCPNKRALILKGGQDAGKSTFVSKLAKHWGTELPSGTGETDFVRLCTRTWIMELAECDRLFKGKEASILKQQLSTTVDKYIPKYKEADEASETPRTTVFIGTTNKSQFLVDETGNTRFWTIELPDGWKLPLDWLDENIDHIWATAYQLLSKGYPTDLPEIDIDLSEIRNREFMLEGTWVEPLERLLELATLNGQRDIAFKAIDILSAMGINLENHARSKTQVISSLKQLGYDSRVLRPFPGAVKTEKYYCLKTAKKPIVAKFDDNRWSYCQGQDDWIPGSKIEAEIRQARG
ncbi:VapE domain-containing protein [uncultured Nostoc sp.]|uniref:VapE domain-containing protein n=1 Tax=uncultured Nostoc sp. TaxID=340711 RepID=UPI0035CB39DE